MHVTRTPFHAISTRPVALAPGAGESDFTCGKRMSLCEYSALGSRVVWPSRLSQELPGRRAPARADQHSGCHTVCAQAATQSEGGSAPRLPHSLLRAGGAGEAGDGAGSPAPSAPVCRDRTRGGLSYTRRSNGFTEDRVAGESWFVWGATQVPGGNFL